MAENEWNFTRAGREEPDGGGSAVAGAAFACFAASSHVNRVRIIKRDEARLRAVVFVGPDGPMLTAIEESARLYFREYVPLGIYVEVNVTRQIRA